MQSVREERGSERRSRMVADRRLRQLLFISLYWSAAGGSVRC